MPSTETATVGGSGRPADLGAKIVESITLEDMADLLIDVGLDEGCDYDDEIIDIVLDGLWTGEGGGYTCPAIICIMELLKRKGMAEDEYVRLRQLVVEGMRE